MSLRRRASRQIGRQRFPSAPPAIRLITSADELSHYLANDAEEVSSQYLFQVGFRVSSFQEHCNQRRHLCNILEAVRGRVVPNSFCAFAVANSSSAFPLRWGASASVFAADSKRLFSADFKLHFGIAR